MVIKNINRFFLVLLACSALPLMVGCTASPNTLPATNEEELPTYQMEIDLLGIKHEASVDSQGRLKTSVQVTSADGTISLSIDADTILLDKDGKPLQFIHIAIDPGMTVQEQAATKKMLPSLNKEQVDYLIEQANSLIDKTIISLFADSGILM